MTMLLLQGPFQRVKLGASLELGLMAGLRAGQAFPSADLSCQRFEFFMLCISGTIHWLP